MDEVPDLVAVPDSEFATDLQKKKVPLSLLSPISTAGKAELLSYILHENHGKKVVVIESFVEEDKASEGDDTCSDEDSTDPSMEWMQFPNGCVHVCVKYGLYEALEYLEEHKYPFDAVILDTEGLALLSPFATAIWEDEELGSRIYLDGIITILDFETINEHLTDNREEIAISDCLLVNNIQNNHQNHVIEQIRMINNATKCFSLCEGKIDLNLILNIDAFGNSGTLVLEEELLSMPQTPENLQTDQISSICLVHNNPMEKKVLLQWLARLTWDNEETEIMRVKGIVNIKDEDCRFVLQELFEMFELSKSDFSWENTKRFTKLVITGRNLNMQSLQNDFRACEYPDE